MSGSTYGTQFAITTWGESHGPVVGVIIDGCPAGLSLTELDIQPYLDRRRPGQSRFTTARRESDTVEILSGVFEGVTTGTPISLMVQNQDHRSKDYGDIKNYMRPGHADYPFQEKFGIRDYRGGGRSSGRETIGRVAAGAIAAKLLSCLGITLTAYTKSIGPISIPNKDYDYDCIYENPLYMPNTRYAKEAECYLDECRSALNSAGGIIECIITGVPAGIGEPVFDKLDASLAKAVMSIGAVKGVEIGDGFAVSASNGSDNNDCFFASPDGVQKETNHAGGILGGISDGSAIMLRAAIKPTPSIGQSQKTVDMNGTDTEITITGRHDPVIVPRAVVVVESMAAVTVADLLLSNMTSRMDGIKRFYEQ